MLKNPKISIITIVKNGMPFLDNALESYNLQKYKNKELIVVYTNSSDKTLKTLKSKKFITKIITDNFSKNIYGSINYGIKKSSGDVIGLLHSDDIFFDKNVLSNIARMYNKSSFEVAYGNIIISKRNQINNPFREWKSDHFQKKSLKFGWMPPHTSVYISKRIKNIKYSTKYKISSDYDYLLRILSTTHKIKFLNFYTTIMRSGGLSNKNLMLKFKEDLQVIKNFFYFYRLIAVLKILRKINQFFMIDKNFKNKDYLKLFINKERKLIKNTNRIIKEKKFILSGFNLAYLAFVHDKINFEKKYLYLWPDGILAKIMLKINKVPGRKILEQIENHKYFKNVYLISSKNKKNLDYVKKKFFNKKVIFIEAPYGNDDYIFNKIKKKISKINSNSIILLGLPTPKQELIAAKISNCLDDYRIICLGGAINYNSKDTKIPPKIFENYFESIWRLQNDTLRRSLRLFNSCMIFLKRLIFNEFKNI